MKLTKIKIMKIDFMFQMLTNLKIVKNKFEKNI